MRSGERFDEAVKDAEEAIRITLVEGTVTSYLATIYWRKVHPLQEKAKVEREAGHVVEETRALYQARETARTAIERIGKLSKDKQAKCQKDKNWKRLNNLDAYKRLDEVYKQIDEHVMSMQ